MNNHKSSSELKSLARGQLLGKYGVLIGAMVLQTCIIMMLQLFGSMFFTAIPAIYAFISIILNIILSVFSGIFTAGLCLMYLKTSCRYQVSFHDIFWGFQHNPLKIMQLQFPLTILETLCMLPSYYMQFRFLSVETPDYMAYGLMLLFSGLGSFLFILLSLAFSQVFFLLHDFPAYSFAQLYAMSVRIMKGHKLRLLYIELSFIPLYLICFLTCGIGLLWLTPYINITETNFYLDLMAHRNNEQA